MRRWNTIASEATSSITDAVKVLDLLKRLRDAHAIIEVRQTDQRNTFLSMILEIREADGQLVIDAPRVAWNPGLESDCMLAVQGRLNGIDIRFRVKFLSIEDHQNHPALSVSLPTQMVYREKRSAFRIRLTALATPVEIVHSGQESALEGEVVDLSLGGFGARFSLDALIQGLGEPLSCRLELPDGTFWTKAAIRRITTTRDAQHQYVGAKFIELESDQVRRLERLIAELDRRAMRRGRSR